MTEEQADKIIALLERIAKHVEPVKIEITPQVQQGELDPGFLHKVDGSFPVMNPKVTCKG